MQGIQISLLAHSNLHLLGPVTIEERWLAALHAGALTKQTVPKTGKAGNNTSEAVGRVVLFLLASHLPTCSLQLGKQGRINDLHNLLCFAGGHCQTLVNPVDIS